MNGRDPFSLLDQVLREELKRGCDDRAVTRGLDAFLANWRTNLSMPERSLPLLLKTEYHALNGAARRRALEEALLWIEQHRKASDSPADRQAPRPRRPASRPNSLVRSRPAADTLSDTKADQPPPSSQRPKRARSGSAPEAPATGPYARRFGLPDLDRSVATLRGVQTTTASRLRRLGVESIGDLLFLFPNRHEDFSRLKSISELTVGADETIIGTIWEARNRPSARGRKITEVIVGDETGTIRVVWFNQPYLLRSLTQDKQIVISGRVGVFQGLKVFQSPEYELLEREDRVHTGRLVPIYPLTEGLSQRSLRRLVKTTVDHWAPALADPLPEAIRSRHRLALLPDAFTQRHYPDSPAAFQAARRRLAFDELFVIHLAALQQKRQRQEAGPAAPLKSTAADVTAFAERLPFELTRAQRRVLGQILDDIAKPQAMARLLQGEVGSGKTVIAAAALWVATRSGLQGALMAPTEILAEQHFRNLTKLLAEVPIALLVGSTSKREKQELYGRIARGEVGIVVGTHAVIEDDVAFDRLGLVVIDEQHRFGVRQRKALREKGNNPHLLVMTATPIPRTLALTLYGDLDLSVIDELPPGRKEIQTKVLKPNQRLKAYEFIRRQITEGRQAFIICPLVEESERIDARAALAEHERLARDVFPDLRVGLLHGRMRPAEKDDVMRLFRDHELDILVSTAVVEVGIDVPNATVMLIEGADRFGLAQLHQFRGRVGRGEHQSYCLLLTETTAAETHERLSIIERTQDGMELAEADLRLRGPGEFFGIRQSGLPDLRSATLADLDLFELARSEAEALLRQDPDLSLPQHALLAAQVEWLGRDAGEVG